MPWYLCGGVKVRRAVETVVDGGGPRDDEDPSPHRRGVLVQKSGGVSLGGAALPNAAPDRS